MAVFRGGAEAGGEDVARGVRGVAGNVEGCKAGRTSSSSENTAIWRRTFAKSISCAAIPNAWPCDTSSLQHMTSIASTSSTSTPGACSAAIAHSCSASRTLWPFLFLLLRRSQRPSQRRRTAAARPLA